MCSGGGDHMAQLGLIGGGHHHETRQIGEESHIKCACVGWPVSADQSGAVDGEAHGQALDRDVMHDLIVAALQECRIHGAEGFHPRRRKSRAEGHAMLLGNAHVEAAAGVAFGEKIKAGAVGHGGCHGADLVVLGGLSQQAVGKNAGVAGCVGGGLLLLARHHVELGRGMAPVARGFGRAIALALLRLDVDQDRPRRALMNGAQHGQQLVHVVPVDRAKVGKAEVLEQGAADRHALEHILGAFRAFAERFGQQAHRALGGGFEVLKRRFGVKAAEVARHRAHGRGDGHLIVVEDDDQAFLQIARVVERLIGHARAHRAVADHGDRVAQSFGDHAAQIAAHGEAERC